MRLRRDNHIKRRVMHFHYVFTFVFFIFPEIRFHLQTFPPAANEMGCRHVLFFPSLKILKTLSYVCGLVHYRLLQQQQSYRKRISKWKLLCLRAIFSEAIPICIGGVAGITVRLRNNFTELKPLHSMLWHNLSWYDFVKSERLWCNFK